LTLRHPVKGDAEDGLEPESSGATDRPVPLNYMVTLNFEAVSL
jgi:hypothetical protein